MKEIIKIIDPKIKLDEIYVDDIWEGTIDPNISDSKKYYKAYGVYYPMVSINKYVFGKNDIISLVLDSSEFLPTISLSIQDKTGIFTSKYFPMDGDICSVHIRTQSKKYKGIRCDFEIVKISGSQTISDIQNGAVYSIQGVLRVPNIFVDQCFSIDNKTSINALIDTAKLLELGFASNETKTNDQQNWICPFSNIKYFINKTTLHSYLNDKSFFSSYIDFNYFLNFVNINDIFQIDADPIDVEIINLMNTEEQEGDTEVLPEQVPLILSNSPLYENSPNFIVSYSIFNNSGDINIRNGYRRYVQYYDMAKVSYNESFIEALNTENSQDRKTNKGRADDDYQNRIKYKYIGEFDIDNVHQNYKIASIQNYQNLEDINKTGIIVDLPTFNPTLRKFMIVPIIIMHIYNEALASQQNDKNQGQYVADDFLSGNYIIKDIKIIFDGVSMYQRLILIRREW